MALNFIVTLDKFKEILTSLSAENRLKVLCMQNSFIYQSEIFFRTTVLHIKAERGHTETVKCILDSVPAADLYKLICMENIGGNTVVHRTAGRGHTETMKSILDSVPTTDLIDLLTLNNVDGETVIHLFTFIGHSEIIKTLAGTLPAT